LIFFFNESVRETTSILKEGKQYVSVVVCWD